MAFVDPTTPNLADFITFCQTQGVASDVLSTTSPYYTWAFTYATDRVYTVPLIPAIDYIIACYNLGMHWLVENAQDTLGLTVSSLSWAGGLVTAAAAAPTGFTAGQTFAVQIVGAAPVGYNGSFTATAVSANDFTYPMPTSPGANTAPGLFNLAFFSSLRATWNLLSLTPGVIQSTDDQGTGATLLVPDFFKTVTLNDLDLMKTPWGRRYLSYAQSIGPTIVGVN